LWHRLIGLVNISQLEFSIVSIPVNINSKYWQGRFFYCWSHDLLSANDSSAFWWWPV